MKAFTAIFLALIITLSLAACGAAPEETLPTEPETQATIPETTAPTEDPRIAQYDAALALLEEGDYDAAKAAFEELGDYSDAPDQARECDYRKAAALLAAGEKKAAWELYGTIPGYKDADTLRESCRFETLLTKTVSVVQGEERYVKTCTYENGRLVEELTCYNEKHPQYIEFKETYPVLRTVYEYEGNTTTLRTYDDKDNPLNFEILTYDENGNRIGLNKIYIKNPSSNYSSTYTFDQNGNMIEQLYWSGDGIGEGNADYKYVVEYDEYGNEIERSAYTWKKKSSYSSTYAWKLDRTITYEYGIDNQGRVLWSGNSTSDRTTEYTYNSQNQVETKVYAGPNYCNTVVYTYDNDGNLIQEQSTTANNDQQTESVIYYTYERLEVLSVPGESVPAEKEE